MNDPKPLPVARDKTVNTLIAEFDRLYGSDQTRDTLLAKFATRAEFGFAKYGNTTHDRTDITMIGWLTHLQEEVMDSIVYSTRILRDVPLDKPEGQQLYMYLRSLMEMAMFCTASISGLEEHEALDNIG